jgi:predicted transcriptional regulator YdeE
MTPPVTICNGFTVLGVRSRNRFGTETPELFRHVWQSFEARRPEIAAVATQPVYFGVSFPTDEEGVTDYLAGMMVASDTAAPDGLETRAVPSGEYVVFECPVEEIGATYQHIFGVWLPTAPVLFDPVRPPFEEYPESTPLQPVRLHIPVRQP